MAYKFEKLTRDKEERTEIMCGQTKMTVQQLDDEMKTDSDIGRKLRSVKDYLDKHY